jgi:hypothetical protein
MKVVHKRVEQEEVDWIHWVRDMDQWWALVSIAMKDEFYLPRCYVI